MSVTKDRRDGKTALKVRKTETCEPRAGQLPLPVKRARRPATLRLRDGRTGSQKNSSSRRKGARPKQRTPNAWGRHRSQPQHVKREMPKEKLLGKIVRGRMGAPGREEPGARSGQQGAKGPKARRGVERANAQSRSEVWVRAVAVVQEKRPFRDRRDRRDASHAPRAGDVAKPRSRRAGDYQGRIECRGVEQKKRTANGRRP